MDCFSSEKRSEIMSAVGNCDTEPELRLRSALWERGLRYRVNRKVGQVRPDLVFVGPRVAVFVDGCFWHGCPEHYSEPKTNREFWRAKIESNHARDHRNSQKLRDDGWIVLRFWECEVHKELERLVNHVESTVSCQKAG